MKNITKPAPKTTDRQLRALAEAANYVLIPQPEDGLFLVESKQGKRYLTSATSCTCPDAVERRTHCKHQIIVGWSSAMDAPSPRDTATVARYEAQEALYATG